MTLSEFYAAHLTDGRSRLADAMKSLVHRHDPVIFTLLDFDNETPFLDTLIFAIAGGKLSPEYLRQILVGYLAPNGRRQLGPIPVRSDPTGNIYLPNVGYIRCEPIEAELTLGWDPTGFSPVLQLGGQVVPSQLEDLLRVSGTGVEIWQDNYLEPFFVSDDDAAVSVNLRTCGQQHAGATAVAMDILSQFCPYHGEIISSTSRIALFDNRHLNSFASLAAHGTAFLNVHYGVDEVYLVEDIVHQSGHIAFSNATVERTALFEISPDATLRESAGPEGDDRTVYVALHGLVTEAMMCETLGNWFENGSFSSRRQHREVAGRLAYAATRFFLDLRILNRSGIFGPVGADLFVELMSSFRELYVRHRDLINKLDLDGQPYNFSYPIFCIKNPAARIDEIIGLSPATEA